MKSKQRCSSSCGIPATGAKQAFSSGRGVGGWSPSKQQSKQSHRHRNIAVARWCARGSE
uniref:Uncharacterized protein n=1 Tax=Anopheles albimanus TaxID=7167 RepID=A0A182FZF6_ANOAL